MDADTSDFRPPYMSFQTFWNFLDELAAKPLPPRVDRSLMTSKSGTDQANLTMALTSFGFTDAEGRVQPALAALVAAPSDQRPGIFGDCVRRCYAAPLAVSAENGTPADLNTAFSETWPSIASADTRRKSITFFLHAARTAGIELSPHFPQTRSGSGAPGVARRKTATRRVRSVHDSAKAHDTPTVVPTRAAGERRTVNFGEAGTVVIDVDVRWLDLPDETFLKLRKIVADLEALGAAPVRTSAATEGAVS